MTQFIKTHYQALFGKYRYSPLAVQQMSLAEQHRRFAILTAGMERTASVIDLGCGFGDMLPYLRSAGHEGRYLGVDLVPEFIETARSVHGQAPGAAFQEFDIRTDEIPQGYDFGVVCGVFNNRFPEGGNEEFLFETIKRLFAAAGRGIAFNALSTYVEYTDDDLFYVDPLQVFDFCKRNLTQHVALKHDYVLREKGYPYEFTMFLSKDPVR